MPYFTKFTLFKCLILHIEIGWLNRLSQLFSACLLINPTGKISYLCASKTLNLHKNEKSNSND